MIPLTGWLGCRVLAGRLAGGSSYVVERLNGLGWVDLRAAAAENPRKPRGTRRRSGSLLLGKGLRGSGVIAPYRGRVRTPACMGVIVRLDRGLQCKLPSAGVDGAPETLEGPVGRRWSAGAQPGPPRRPPGRMRRHPRRLPAATLTNSRLGSVAVAPMSGGRSPVVRSGAPQANGMVRRISLVDEAAAVGSVAATGVRR